MQQKEEKGDPCRNACAKAGGGKSPVEVRCALCGRKEELTKVHKDYQRLAANPQSLYICARCSQRVQFEALEEQKSPKPI